MITLSHDFWIANGALVFVAATFSAALVLTLTLWIRSSSAENAAKNPAVSPDINALRGQVRTATDRIEAVLAEIASLKKESAGVKDEIVKDAPRLWAEMEALKMAVARLDDKYSRLTVMPPAQPAPAVSFVQQAPPAAPPPVQPAPPPQAAPAPVAPPPAQPSAPVAPAAQPAAAAPAPEAPKEAPAASPAPAAPAAPAAEGAAKPSPMDILALLKQKK